MGKEKIIELKNTEALISFSNEIEGNKHLRVNVPQNYRALIYVDGKCCRLDAGDPDNLYKAFGKIMLGNIRVAFVRKSITPTIKWGFGDINVNNERLKEAYRVGINGGLTFELEDPKEIIKKLGMDKDITSEDLRLEVLSTIKTVGIPILSKFFANTNCSVFEINSKMDVLRDEMTRGIKEEKMFTNLGIRVLSLTMNPIFVNEEDLEIIRNRINN